MDKDLEKIKGILLNEQSVILAYLFGSRAKAKRGINQRSDWDFGIYFTQAVLDAKPWHDFILGAKLSQILGAEAQIVVLNKPLPSLLGSEIVGKGYLVVNKDENLRLSYENRTLRNYFDWSYRLSNHSFHKVPAPMESVLSKY